MSKTNSELQNEVKELKRSLESYKSALDTASSNSVNNHKRAEAVEAKYKHAIESNTHLIETLDKKQDYINKLDSMFGKRLIEQGKPKQLHINLEAICRDNGIEHPSSMTISEAKKVLFCLKNVFQESKAFGE